MGVAPQSPLVGVVGGGYRCFDWVWRGGCCISLVDSPQHLACERRQRMHYHRLLHGDRDVVGGIARGSYVGGVWRRMEEG